MNIQFIPSDSRGHANYGWLDTYYSFSFANYYNPARMGFGPLRVMNDDTIAPNNGFPMHSHRDMEIITIMFEGELTHKDSMGNESVLKPGNIQVMSAGTGVTHSEMNDSKYETVKLFQIWVVPDKFNVTPRYDETKFSSPQNSLSVLVSPFGDASGSINIYQQTYISLGNYDKEETISYTKKFPGHGLKIMVISGELVIGEHTLSDKDSVEITDIETIEISTTKDTKFIIFDV